MGCFDLALADAVKSTEIKPDWAKGYFRKGAALQALGRHEEAFQSFYECLTLEDEKAAKQVKRSFESFEFRKQCAAAGGLYTVTVWILD